MVTYIFQTLAKKITYFSIKIRLLLKTQRTIKKRTKKKIQHNLYNKHTRRGKYTENRPKKNLIVKCIINTDNYHNNMKHDELNRVIILYVY